MRKSSEDYLSEVAEDLVDFFVPIATKRVLILISIALSFLALAAYLGANFRKEPYVPGFMIGTIFFLFYRRDFYIKKFKNYLLDNNIFMIKAKGRELSSTRRYYSFVNAFDVNGNEWKNLKCIQSLKFYEIEKEQVCGYIVIVEPFKEALFINADLMQKINKISNKIKFMPQNRVPVYKDNSKINKILFKFYIIIFIFTIIVFIVGNVYQFITENP
ncbi:hypothetical protein N9N67_02785 [Bacteriovoracaceae bacterium]|nr:hypothetical protein [Bacteriovoracaceae bacterium]